MVAAFTSICGISTVLSSADSAETIVYKSAAFVDNFTKLKESDEALFSTENVTVENGEIATGTYGKGIVVSDETVITTNMGFGEFDLFLTISDDTTSGDSNKRGAMISFANGNTSKYNLYLVGNYISLGTWLLKDGVNIAPDWVMMASATGSCKYKIEVREGSVSVKHWSESEQSYVYSAAFPYYFESEEISNVSGYITIQKCAAANGTFIVNEISIDPVADDVLPTATSVNPEVIELGASGSVAMKVELSEKRFSGVFINDNILDDSMYKLSTSKGIINSVVIDKKAFAYEYSKNVDIKSFDVDIISHDKKYSALVKYSIGEVEIQFVDAESDLISTQNIEVGSKIKDLDLFDDYISYGFLETKRGIDGKMRDYISIVDEEYRFYKATKVYCLTEDYQCSVYLYTYDNFGEWNDAIKVLVPRGVSFRDYIEQVNSDDNIDNDITVSNPYGKIFTKWDYEDVISQDMDIHAEYYNLKGNGQDLEVKFDKEPSNSEIKKVLLIQGSSSVTYDGNMNIPNAHVWNSVMSTQQYTDFEYSIDIKRLDGCHTNDWSFALAFGAPNHDQAYPFSRKFSVSFKNVYIEESQSFLPQLVISEGGDNVSNWSAKTVVQSNMITPLTTSDARIIEAVEFYDKTGLYRYNSGLSDEEYVSIKIRVVDRTLTVYAKTSKQPSWTEEISCKLSYDTTGYVTYYQTHTETNAYGTLVSIDNLKIKNLANEQHEITVTQDGNSYDAPDKALAHKIGEKQNGNDIAFDYLSRYQSFVGTMYIICDEDWNPLTKVAKELLVEQLNAQRLTRTATLSDKALSEIYQAHISNVYGADKTLNVIVRVLTDNDYADIHMKLTVEASYKMYVKKNASSETEVFAGAGAFGQELDFAKYTEYFSDYIIPQEGYQFVGWEALYEGTVYRPNEKVTLYKNMVIVPHFELKTYTVKFVDEEGTVFDEMTVTHGEDSKLPTFIPESDKGKFLKWDDNYTNVTSDRAVLAIFDDSGNDTPVADKGCSNTITGISGIMSGLGIATALLVTKKSKKNEESLK